MTEIKKVGMLHYPALLCGAGDKGFILFAACDSIREAEAALEREEVQAELRDHDQGMRARGNYDAEAAQCVLSSADLFEALAAEQLSGWEGELEDCFRDEYEEGGEREYLRAFAAEVGVEPPELGFEEARAILVTAAGGDGEGAARRLIERASSDAPRRQQALQGPYLQMDEFSEDGEELIRRRRDDEKSRRLREEDPY